MEKMARSKGGRAVIIAGGDLGNIDWCRSAIAADDKIICADGGAAHALALDLAPDLVVGDFDSLSDPIRRRLEEKGVCFIDYPVEKNYSDLDLAVRYALKLNPQEIIIFGALGGSRIEHTFANMMLLLLPMKEGIPARILDRECEITVINRELTVKGEPGDYLSLFPITAAAEGITTQGLRYPLKKETLYLASTRGLSNELLERSAKITLEKGLLLAVRSSRRSQKAIP